MGILEQSVELFLKKKYHRPDKQVIENIPVAIKDTVVSLRTA